MQWLYIIFCYHLSFSAECYQHRHSKNSIVPRMQYKPKRNKTIHRFCFFIAHHDRLRTYDRRTDDDILLWCSYKSSVLTVGTFWTCYMHSYFVCKGTKNFWLLQIIFINNCVCYIGVQNLYKNDLHPRSPTTQLRLNFDIPSIKPRSNGTFFVKNYSNSE